MVDSQIHSLSQEKLIPTYQHEQGSLGGRTNTRWMTVACQPEKRTRAVADLKLWIGKTEFQLLEAAELAGSLGNLSQYNRRGQAYFFALQNAIRRALTQRYHKIKHW